MNIRVHGRGMKRPEQLGAKGHVKWNERPLKGKLGRIVGRILENFLSLDGTRFSIQN